MTANPAATAAAPLPERVGPKAITRGFETFAATLDRKQALLSIDRPVEFDFTDPSREEEAAEIPTHRKWNGETEKTAFKSRFVHEVSEAWSNKHVLVPDGDPHGETLSAVNVAVAASEAGSPEVPPIHLTVRALQKGALEPQQGILGSSGHLLDTSVEKTATDQGKRSQVVAAHELGHALGLEHPVCHGAEDRCYGVTESERSSIMGKGMDVRAEDYAPFVQAMDALSPAKWKVQAGQGWWSRFGAWVLLGGGAAVGAVLGAFVGGGLGALVGAGIGLGIGALIHKLT